MLTQVPQHLCQSRLPDQRNPASRSASLKGLCMPHVHACMCFFRTRIPIPCQCWMGQQRPNMRSTGTIWAAPLQTLLRQARPHPCAVGVTTRQQTGHPMVRQCWTPSPSAEGSSWDRRACASTSKSACALGGVSSKGRVSSCEGSFSVC